jgi:hypothetical protein
VDEAAGDHSGAAAGGDAADRAAGRRRKRGHFAPSTWRVRGPRHAHEVAISPLLFTTPEALLATMVHEAVHALLYATVSSDVHVGGVSLRDPYYHRREFRDACAAVGLDCRYLNGRYGWTLTDWPEGRVPDQYRHVASILKKLPLGSGGRRRVARRGEADSDLGSGPSSMRVSSRSHNLCRPEAGRAWRNYLHVLPVGVQGFRSRHRDARGVGVASVLGSTSRAPFAAPVHRNTP